MAETSGSVTPVRVTLILALALVLSGCGSAEESAPPTPESPAGSITGRTLEGETVSLDDFRGTPVFVNVWSSW